MANTELKGKVTKAVTLGMAAVMTTSAPIAGVTAFAAEEADTLKDDAEQVEAGKSLIDSAKDLLDASAEAEEGKDTVEDLEASKDAVLAVEGEIAELNALNTTAEAAKKAFLNVSDEDTVEEMDELLTLIKNQESAATEALASAIANANTAAEKQEIAEGAVKAATAILERAQEKLDAANTAYTVADAAVKVAKTRLAKLLEDNGLVEGKIIYSVDENNNVAVAAEVELDGNVKTAIEEVGKALVKAQNDLSEAEKELEAASMDASKKQEVYDTAVGALEEAKMAAEEAKEAAEKLYNGICAAADADYGIAVAKADQKKATSEGLANAAYNTALEIADAARDSAKKLAQDTYKATEKTAAVIRDAAKEKAEKDYQADLQKADLEHSNEIEAANTKKEAAIAKADSDYETAVQKAVAAKDAAVQAANDLYDTEKEAALSKQTAAVEKANSDYSKTVAEAAETQRVAIANAASAYSEAEQTARTTKANAEAAADEKYNSNTYVIAAQSGSAKVIYDAQKVLTSEATETEKATAVETIAKEVIKGILGQSDVTFSKETKKVGDANVELLVADVSGEKSYYAYQATGVTVTVTIVNEGEKRQVTNSVEVIDEWTIQLCDHTGTVNNGVPNGGSKSPDLNKKKNNNPNENNDFATWYAKYSNDSKYRIYWLDGTEVGINKDGQFTYGTGKDAMVAPLHWQLGAFPVSTVKVTTQEAYDAYVKNSSIEIISTKTVKHTETHNNVIGTETLKESELSKLEGLTENVDYTKTKTVEAVEAVEPEDERYVAVVNGVEEFVINADEISEADGFKEIDGTYYKLNDATASDSRQPHAGEVNEDGSVTAVSVDGNVTTTDVYSWGDETETTYSVTEDGVVATTNSVLVKNSTSVTETTKTVNVSNPTTYTSSESLADAKAKAIAALEGDVVEGSVVGIEKTNVASSSGWNYDYGYGYVKSENFYEYGWDYIYVTSVNKREGTYNFRYATFVNDEKDIPVGAISVELKEKHHGKEYTVGYLYVLLNNVYSYTVNSYEVPDVVVSDPVITYESGVSKQVIYSNAQALIHKEAVEAVEAVEAEYEITYYETTRDYTLSDTSVTSTDYKSNIDAAQTVKEAEYAAANTAYGEAVDEAAATQREAEKEANAAYANATEAAESIKENAISDAGSTYVSEEAAANTKRNNSVNDANAAYEKQAAKVASTKENAVDSANKAYNKAVRNADAKLLGAKTLAYTKRSLANATAENGYKLTVATAKKAKEEAEKAADRAYEGAEVTATALKNATMASIEKTYAKDMKKASDTCEAEKAAALVAKTAVETAEDGKVSDAETALATATSEKTTADGILSEVTVARNSIKDRRDSLQGTYNAVVMAMDDLRKLEASADVDYVGLTTLQSLVNDANASLVNAQASANRLAEMAEAEAAAAAAGQGGQETPAPVVTVAPAPVAPAAPVAPVVPAGPAPAQIADDQVPQAPAQDVAQNTPVAENDVKEPQNIEDDAVALAPGDNENKGIFGNTMAFIGGLIVAILAGISLFFFFVKKKKDEEEEKAQ